MNQKLWSGLAATLLIATLIAPSYADQSQSAAEGSEADLSQIEPLPEQGASTLAASDSTSPATQPNPQIASAAQEVVKVGEYQSQEDPQAEASITTIYPHTLEGRQAVTLYVRDIPVLTFLGSSADSVAANHPSPPANPDSATVKVASLQENSAQPRALDVRAVSAAASAKATDAPTTVSETSAAEDSNDPVWRATAIAARLNQLHRENFDANEIKVEWDDQRRRYLIKADANELVEMNSDTVLPNTTEDPAEDALQATNRIRRQMGAAPPLSSISGDPRSSQVSLGPIRFTVSGLASWYGPGFDGNYSASGEVFNQHAMTAAHPDLPFGTQVRVTNLDNGLSVVVRINDRGPHIADRIIDLSAGAAQVIGLVQSGVAPVSLEVLGSARTASNSQNAN